jgi:hypothetical protein
MGKYLITTSDEIIDHVINCITMPTDQDLGNVRGGSSKNIHVNTPAHNPLTNIKNNATYTICDYYIYSTPTHGMITRLNCSAYRL